MKKKLLTKQSVQPPSRTLDFSISRLAFSMHPLIQRLGNAYKGENIPRGGNLIVMLCEALDISILCVRRHLSRYY